MQTTMSLNNRYVPRLPTLPAIGFRLAREKGRDQTAVSMPKLQNAGMPRVPPELRTRTSSLFRYEDVQDEPEDDQRCAGCKIIKEREAVKDTPTVSSTERALEVDPGQSSQAFIDESIMKHCKEESMSKFRSVLPSSEPRSRFSTTPALSRDDESVAEVVDFEDVLEEDCRAAKQEGVVDDKSSIGEIQNDAGLSAAETLRNDDEYCVPESWTVPLHESTQVTPGKCAEVWCCEKNDPNGVVSMPGTENIALEIRPDDCITSVDSPEQRTPAERVYEDMSSGTSSCKPPLTPACDAFLWKGGHRAPEPSFAKPIVGSLHDQPTTSRDSVTTFNPLEDCQVASENAQGYFGSDGDAFQTDPRDNTQETTRMKINHSPMRSLNVAGLQGFSCCLKMGFRVCRNFVTLPPRTVITLASLLFSVFVLSPGRIYAKSVRSRMRDARRCSHAGTCTKTVREASPARTVSIKAFESTPNLSSENTPRKGDDPDDGFGPIGADDTEFVEEQLHGDGTRGVENGDSSASMFGGPQAPNNVSIDGNPRFDSQDEYIAESGDTAIVISSAIEGNESMASTGNSWDSTSEPQSQSLPSEQRDLEVSDGDRSRSLHSVPSLESSRANSHEFASSSASTRYGGDPREVQSNLDQTLLQPNPLERSNQTISGRQDRNFLGTKAHKMLSRAFPSKKRAVAEVDIKFASGRSCRKTITILKDLLTNEMGAVVSMKRGAFKMKCSKDYDVQRRICLTIVLKALDDYSCTVYFTQGKDNTTPDSDFISFADDVHRRFVAQTSQGKERGSQESFL